MEIFTEKYQTIRSVGSKFGDAVLVRSEWDGVMWVAWRNRDYRVAKVLMKASQKFRDPNIVATKETFWSKSQYQFVMVNEFCSYGSLSKQMRSGFPEDVIRICLFDMVSAL
jgi:serine/threonine protein kinase